MKTNLHKTYYLLAIIDVITIMITLFLAYSIFQTYEKSFQVNEQWMQRSIKYDLLTDLAIDANGPGNNVFDSRDVSLESRRLKDVNEKINGVRDYLIKDANDNLSSYPEIIKHLDRFSNLIDQANQYTHQIFQLIEKNKLGAASENMSKMDSKFHAALLEISKLRNTVRSIQNDQLLLYHKKAKGIFYKEFYVASFIFLLVCLILYFGQKIKASFDTIMQELDKKNNNLSDSKAKLNSILHTLLESVILIDDKGKIEYLNPATEKIFEYEQTEMLGKNIKFLMPHRYASEHDGYLKKYLSTRKEKVVGKMREVEAKKKSGDIFPIELGVSEVQLKDKTMFTGIVKDISEKKRAEFYLASITKVQEMYINGEPQKNIFNEIIDFLLKYTKSEYGFIGAIYFSDENRPYLKTYAITNIAWNEKMESFYQDNLSEGLEFRNLETLFGYTMKTGEVVLSNDPENDPRSGGIPEGHPKMHAYLGMPIIGNDGLIAMYGIANKKGGYSKSDIKELSAITTVVTSIIESARSLSLIEKMANRDALTGAYNRFYFKSYVQELLRQRSREKHPKNFAIMMIDFNKFKHINDYYGHEYGDYIIKEFVNRTQNKIKTKDLLARIGGDEFVILVDDIDDFANAGKFARRVVEASKNPYIYNDTMLECSVSVGIACYPISGKDINELLRHADLALYKAKKSVDGYCYFSENLQDRYLEKQNLEKDILNAFNNEELYIVIQPKVNIHSCRVIGGEVLIRWKHPKKGNIPMIFENACFLRR